MFAVRVSRHLRILSVVAAAFVFIPSAHAAVSTDSLVGYWKFDEGTGILAADSSGHGNHGTLTGGPTWSADPTNNISFINPYALDFDGTDDRIEITSTFGLGSTNITLSTWANLDSVSEGGSFIKTGEPHPNGGFSIGVGGSDYEDTGNNLTGISTSHH